MLQGLRDAFLARFQPEGLGVAAAHALGTIQQGADEVVQACGEQHRSIAPRVEGHEVANIYARNWIRGISQELVSGDQAPGIRWFDEVHCIRQCCGKCMGGQEKGILMGEIEMTLRAQFVMGGPRLAQNSSQAAFPMVQRVLNTNLIEHKQPDSYAELA